MDFPAELGLSYLYGPARAVDPGADDLAACVAAWQQLSGLWHFNGIDNAFYFGILYPAVFAAAGVRGAEDARRHGERAVPAGRAEVLHQPQSRSVGR